MEKEKHIQKLDNGYTLVTGATGGLGRAFCFELAQRKHKLFLTGTSDERLGKLQSEILASFPETIIQYKACDLSNANSIAELCEHLKSENIKINMLINNAGFITEGSIKNAELDTLLNCIKVNCEGTIHLTKSLLDSKSPQEPLNIISVTSMAGNYPMPYMAIYSATKAMLNNFMTSLRYEYKDQNVKVLIVEPGAIATSQDMKDAIASQGLKGKLSSVPPEKIASRAIQLSLKNKKKFVPGFFNKLTLFVSLLAPTSLQVKAVAKMWRKSQEKRNIK